MYTLTCSLCILITNIFLQVHLQLNCPIQAVCACQWQQGGWCKGWWEQERRWWREQGNIIVVDEETCIHGLRPRLYQILQGHPPSCVMLHIASTMFHVFTLQHQPPELIFHVCINLFIKQCHTITISIPSIFLFYILKIYKSFL